MNSVFPSKHGPPKLVSGSKDFFEMLKQVQHDKLLGRTEFTQFDLLNLIIVFAILIGTMDTFNITLPSQLKDQANALIKKGFYVSFNDVVKTAVRRLVADTYYDRLAQKAKRDHKRGLTRVLKTKADIDAYVDDMAKT